MNRRYLVLRILLLQALLALSVFSAIAPAVVAEPADVVPRHDPAADLSQARLGHHVSLLASPAFAGRRGLGGARAALYIADHFYELGLRPLFADSYFQSIRHPTSGREMGRNVGAWLPGSDPELRQECVIVSAHFDHLGVRRGVLFPGADDNASGVAMLLEVARQFTRLSEPPRRSVLFVAFDLEEIGLWGSRWFARNSPWPMQRIGLFLTADMLGRSIGNLPTNYLFVLGTEHAPELRKTLAACRTERELEVALLGTDLIGTRSDYGPFRDRKVPYLFFSTGEHADYHQPTDTPDRVDYPKLARASRLIMRVTHRAAGQDTLPRWRDMPATGIEEVQVVHDILALLLAREGPDALTGSQHYLVSSAHTTLGRILERGHISRAERQWLARVCMLILAGVL